MKIRVNSFCGKFKIISVLFVLKNLMEVENKYCKSSRCSFVLWYEFYLNFLFFVELSYKCYYNFFF